MIVAEIMQTNLLCCSPETTVYEAARLMSERGVGACVVVSGQHLEGMFSERDVVRAVAGGLDVQACSVGDAMPRQGVAAPPDADLLWAADTMRRHGIRHLPVTEGGMVAGVVSLRDLFAAVEAMLRLDPRGAASARELLAAARGLHSAHLLLFVRVWSSASVRLKGRVGNHRVAFATCALENPCVGEDLMDTEVVGFLRDVAPFDTLEETELLAVVAASESCSYQAGATIMMQAAEPSQFAWVVRHGLVELADEGRVIDQLGEGEMFGHRSMITGEPVSLTVSAQEQTECYRLPAAVVRPVLARAESLRYLVMSVGGRYEMRAREGLAGAESSRRPVGDIAYGEVVVCPPSTTVRDAAQRMVEAGSSSVLVDLGDDLGIVTDHDLRERVVAAGAAPETPVAEVMSAPARTVVAERSSADVLIEMLDSGLRHLPVLDARRNVIGVVTDIDLVTAAARTPFALRATIAAAGDGQALCEAIAQLPQAVIALSEARVPAHTISGVISSAHDAVTCRWIELANVELGSPPAPYTWFTLGSFARREAFPDSDQDNAMAWDAPVDDAETREWMSKLAERVVGGLDTAGIPACKGGAIATKGLFARPVADWERIAGSWLDDPDQEKALILVSLVGDGRAVWGGDVAGARLRAAFARAKDRPRLLHLLELFALSHRPPTGFRKDFVVEHDGEHRGTLNIKKGGLLPIVGLARSAAMSAGVTGASTPARLAAAGAAGTIPAEDVAVLRDAFDLMTDLRMQHQIRQLRIGARPDNYIDPADLNPLVRSYLKDAFQAVSRVQKNLSATMKLGVHAGG